MNKAACSIRAGGITAMLIHPIGVIHTPFYSLDIKPYITAFDTVPHSWSGWLKASPEDVSKMFQQAAHLFANYSQKSSSPALTDMSFTSILLYNIG